MEYSIVMPVYQRLEIINLSINSILKQTILPSELIIVDNNTDKNQVDELIKRIEFFKNRSNFTIRYFKSPKNSGAIARNIGAKNARSELVAFLDSDVILDNDYYEILIDHFTHSEELIAIQGLDRSILENKKKLHREKVFDKFLYKFEQFFETSLLFNRKKAYVSPSLAVAHPVLKKEFDIESQWISTCAGIFKKSIFDKYCFPKEFITYSNNEYVFLSYSLYKNNEGKMIYTSKAKYRDIQTSSGRINKIELMYQIQTYDTYIFLHLFDFTIINILIFIKSRIGHLIFNLFRFIKRKDRFILNYVHSILSVFYPIFHLNEISKGDLSFYEKDFPIN